MEQIERIKQMELRMERAVKQRVPVVKAALRNRQLEERQHLRVEAAVGELLRNFVDGVLDVLLLDDIVERDIAELDNYYGSEMWKQDYADDEAGRLPADLKRGVLSEDGIWNLLSDARELSDRLKTY